MKKSGSWILLVGVFVGGFIAGVVFSAWKLERQPSAPPPVAATEGQQNAEEMKSRLAGLEQMLGAQPGNLKATIQLGDVYFEMGNFSKAIETYRKALEIDPRNADVVAYMGTAYRRLGQTDESVATFRKALEIEPDHALALFNLGIVLRDDKKDYQGALEAWERFLDKAGASPHAVMVKPWVSQLKKKIGATTPENDKK